VLSVYGCELSFFSSIQVVTTMRTDTKNKFDPLTSDNPAAATVKSAGRVLEVLELLGNVRKPLSASEIGRLLDYPKSSTNVLLKCLTNLGYLSFDPDTMHYFPSLRVTSLGAWIPAAMYGMGDAASMLQELHDVSGETITLSMRTGQAMRFIRVLPGKFFIALKMDEGTLAPLFGSSVGAAWLATRPAAEVERLAEIARPMARTRQTRQAIDGTLDSMPQVRAMGYAVAYASLFPDTGAVSMALPPASDGSVLVLAVGGLSDRIRRNEKALARLMRGAITRHLIKTGRS
jgi:DNA-binding IclR family transcriptional regulator